MLEIVNLDAKTVIVRTDTEQEMDDVLESIRPKDIKKEAVEQFFALAQQIKGLEPGYKFNRDDVYGR